MAFEIQADRSVLFDVNGIPSGADAITRVFSLCALHITMGSFTHAMVVTMSEILQRNGVFNVTPIVEIVVALSKTEDLFLILNLHRIAQRLACTGACGAPAQHSARYDHSNEREDRANCHSLGVGGLGIYRFISAPGKTATLMLQYSTRASMSATAQAHSSKAT